MKICNTCKEEKELELFFNNINAKDGKHASCKECQMKKRKYDKDKRSQYYNETKERDSDKIKERRKRHYLNNKEKENIQSKSWKSINKEKVNEYYTKNKDSIEYKEYRKKYSSIRYSKIKDSDEYKETVRRNFKNRLKTDVLYRIGHYMRCSIGSYFRNGGFLKMSKTQEILGCSFEDFKIYIESQFDDWMTWENRGLYNGELNYGWDIDHIIPISSATNECDIIKLSHYTNLRPLCSYINRVVKRDKLN